MKKYFLIGCFATLLINCKESKKNSSMDASYVQALNQNREIRAKNRVNYLELAGLFKLDSTNNTFGKATSNHFVLNIENLANKRASRISGGEWSEPLEYPFIITPPWWATWWAQTSYIILGLLLVWLFIL